MSTVFRKPDGVFGSRRVVAQRFQYDAQLPDRNALTQQKLQHLLDLSQLHHCRDQFLHDGRRLPPRFFHQVFCCVTSQQIRGVVAWFSRFEFGLRVRGGAEITIFRHALYDLVAP